MNHHRTRAQWAALLVLCLPGAGVSQNTQPASVGIEAAPPTKTHGPNDPWTRKTMTGDWGGLRDGLLESGIKPTLSYQHQFQQNFRGGRDTHNGHRFAGSYDFILRLDFEKMHLIERAGFYFKTKSTWGDGIGADKVGARSRVNSDAEGDHPIFVKKWWYRQKFAEERIELRLGNLETCKDLFDVSLYANHEDKDFLNCSSIRNSTIPHRTGIGGFVKIEPIDWFYVQGGAFDAQSRKRRTGFDTAFHDEGWFLSMGEFGFTPEWGSPKGPMPGRYRAGLWYDPQPKTIFQNDRDGRRRPEHRGSDVGLYLSLDQMIWKENAVRTDSQGLGLLARYGWSRDDVNEVSQYWQAGLVYKGLIPTRDTDVIGFSVSQAILSKQFRAELNSRADRETVYEWYYKYHLTPWFIISPDLQVLTHTGGDTDDPSTIIGGVRIRVIF